METLKENLDRLAEKAQKNKEALKKSIAEKQKEIDKPVNK